MRKMDTEYETVWFNPSELKRVMNVADLLANAPNNNKYGWCSGYVWNVMNAFMQSMNEMFFFYCIVTALR